MRAPTQRPRGELDLVEQIRAHGPFEDWRARPSERLGLSRWVLARRASPDRDDLAALAARLTRAARTADEVSHHLVVPTQGTLETPDGAIVQLSADPDGIDLERCPVDEPPVPISAAVWIARQLLEALAHAHALGVTHRNIGPAVVWLSRRGGVQLDFGLSTTDVDAQEMLTTSVDLQFTHPEWAAEPGYHPKQDVYGVTAVLWLLLTGRPFRRTVAPVTYRPASLTRHEVPPLLDEVLEVGLGVDPYASPPAARDLTERLDRVFYAVLNADDDRDGARAVATWIRNLVPARLIDEDSGDSDLAAESIQGRFTRALAARNALVRPEDFTESDFDFDGPGRSEAPYARPAPTRPKNPIPAASTEPWAEAPAAVTVPAPVTPKPTVFARPGMSSPALPTGRAQPRPSSRRAPAAPGALESAPASSPRSPHVSMWVSGDSSAARPRAPEPMWASRESPASARPTEPQGVRGAEGSRVVEAPLRPPEAASVSEESRPEISAAQMPLSPRTRSLWFRGKWFVIGFGVTTTLLLLLRLM